MLDWCDLFNGSIVPVYKYDKLLITGYNYVQEEDSKTGHLIYLLQRMILKQNLRNIKPKEGNEQISTRKVLI